MPIYKGNKEITAIYKGDTPISAIYKGDTLIFSSGTWEQYLYEFIYNSLVPTTINNKQVKNKARVNTIYANGVIENQLVDFKQSNLSGSGVSYSFADNKATFTSTVAGGNRCAITHLSFASGHKYLISFDLTQSKTGTSRFQMFNHNYSAVFTGETFSLTANVKQKCSFIATANFTDSEVGTNISVYMLQNGTTAIGDTLIVENAICIDLTQMFCTGNEPSSLSDNRIQKILDSGYIAYNTGTYKGTDISEISSEPYNLFDGEFEGGYIDSATGELKSDIGNRTRSKNFIKIASGQPYTISSEYFKNVGQTTRFRIFEYDENQNYLGTYYASNNGSLVLNTYTFNFTLSNNCRFIKFDLTLSGSTWTDNPPSQSLVQLAFHRTGTRTGYAPYQTFTPIALKYQGNGAINSHDTLEITSTEYVFTKNTLKITLSGNETVDNLTQYGTNFMGITNLFTTDTQPPLNYLPMFNKRVFNKGSINNLPEGYCYTYGRNFYYNIGTNDQQANIDFITGLEMIYQLATPQVINIPRKHLGVAKVRDLSWNMSASVVGRFSTQNFPNLKPTGSASVIGNAYVLNLIGITQQQMNSTTPTNLSWSVHNSSTSFFIFDNSCPNVTDFINKYGDYYIFYETQSEVADIPFTVEVESGGTITTDSEVLPNIEFNIKCK